MLWKKKKQIIEVEEKPEYPVEELSKHLNEVVDLYYLVMDEARHDNTSILKDVYENFFYVGSAGNFGKHIVNFDSKDMGGRRSAVGLIKFGDEIIYKNEEIYSEVIKNLGKSNYLK